MALASIHIGNLKNGLIFSLNHNSRKEKPAYLLDKEYRKENFNINYLKDDEIIKLYKDKDLLKSGKAKHTKNYTPFHEAILNMPDLDNKIEFEKMMSVFKRRYEEDTGHKILSAYFHRDEGYIEKETNTVKHNLHCHLLIDKTNEVGRVIPIGSRKMRTIQEMVSEVTGLKRGTSSYITKSKHLDGREFGAVVKSIKNKIAENEQSEINEKSGFKSIFNTKSQDKYIKEIRELKKTVASHSRLSGGKDKTISDLKSKLLDQNDLVNKNRRLLNEINEYANIINNYDDTLAVIKEDENKKGRDKVKAMIFGSSVVDTENMKIIADKIPSDKINTQLKYTDLDASLIKEIVLHNFAFVSANRENSKELKRLKKLEQDYDNLLKAEIKAKREAEEQIRIKTNELNEIKKQNNNLMSFYEFIKRIDRDDLINKFQKAKEAEAQQKREKNLDQGRSM
jgi:hypothetical protein